MRLRIRIAIPKRDHKTERERESLGREGMMMDTTCELDAKQWPVAGLFAVGIVGLFPSKTELRLAPSCKPESGFGLEN